MSWTCPICTRALSRPNAWHQCLRKPLEELFTGRAPFLYELFQELHKGVSRWEGVQGSATKNCAVYVAEKTFLVVRPMKAALELKFHLCEVTDEFPVFKIVRWGRRNEHHVRLFEPEDLDGAVWKLLKQSYEDQKTPC
jgi:hypothetical protein